MEALVSLRGVADGGAGTAGLRDRPDSSGGAFGDILDGPHGWDGVLPLLRGPACRHIAMPLPLPPTHILWARPPIAFLE